MGLLNKLFDRNKIYKMIDIDGGITSTGYYQDAWKRLKKNNMAIIGLCSIIILALIAIFAPLVAPYNPAEQNVYNMLGKSSPENWLGTDNLGRDILSRIIYGARVSLSVGVGAEIIAATIGIIMGSLAGFYGGIVDAIISRTIEIFASFPFLLFAIAIMFALGPGLINVFIAIGLVGWTGLARLIRAQIMQLKEKEFVEAAHASGASSARILLKHLLPNCLSTIIVIVSLNIPANIMLESTLSFLGLGVQPPMPSWGEMINTSRMFIRQNPMFSIYPGIAIMIVVLSFNTLGDALRDALDPKLKNL